MKQGRETTQAEREEIANDSPRHDHGIRVNDKRVLRICRVSRIKSTVKYGSNGCTRHAKNPQYLAGNLLDRQFHADRPNEKWLTDVTEFKWYEGAVHKVYLSAIPDIYDMRIVSYVIGESNNNPPVYKTLEKNVPANLYRTRLCAGRIRFPNGAKLRLGALPIEMLAPNKSGLREVSGFAANFNRCEQRGLAPFPHPTLYSPRPQYSLREYCRL